MYNKCKEALTFEGVSLTILVEALLCDMLQSSSNPSTCKIIEEKIYNKTVLIRELELPAFD